MTAVSMENTVSL